MNKEVNIAPPGHVPGTHHGNGIFVPMFHQDGLYDCGLAAFAMVAYTLGVTTERIRIPKYTKALAGLTMQDLIDIAQLNCLNASATATSANAITAAHIPSILFWNTSHFVVLATIEHPHFVVHDPAKGIMRCSYAAFRRHYSRALLQLWR